MPGKKTNEYNDPLFPKLPPKNVEHTTIMKSFSSHNRDRYKSYGMQYMDISNEYTQGNYLWAVIMFMISSN